MAKTKGLKVSLDVFQQTIDLNEITGKPVNKDANLQTEMAQAIVDYIVERASKGRGIGGEKLKSPYSPSYAASLDFKAAGKSKSKVDMTLTGDMLSSVEPIEIKGKKVVIGIADDSQIPKAYNHQVGDTLPKRPWFGVTEEEILENVIPKFKKDLNEL